MYFLPFAAVLVLASQVTGMTTPVAPLAVGAALAALRLVAWRAAARRLHRSLMDAGWIRTGTAVVELTVGMSIAALPGSPGALGLSFPRGAAATYERRLGERLRGETRSAWLGAAGLLALSVVLWRLRVAGFLPLQAS